MTIVSPQRSEEAAAIENKVESCTSLRVLFAAVMALCWVYPNPYPKLPQSYPKVP